MYMYAGGALVGARGEQGRLTLAGGGRPDGGGWLGGGRQRGSVHAAAPVAGAFLSTCVPI